MLVPRFPLQTKREVEPDESYVEGKRSDTTGPFGRACDVKGATDFDHSKKTNKNKKLGLTDLADDQMSLLHHLMDRRLGEILDCSIEQVHILL